MARCVVPVLVALVAGITGGALSLRHPQAARASTPACNNSAHWVDTLSEGCYLRDYQRTVACTGNLRTGPGTQYSTHGTATGTFWVYNNQNTVSAWGQCLNYPASVNWKMSSNGWLSHSIVLR